MTSTYFEGACEGNDLANRGYSRDSRPDCLQVCIGLVVTTDGIPLGYEVFAGNRHDSTTVEEIVEVQLVPGPDGTETFVLARSMDRREKEKSMHQRFVDRLETALRKMQASAENGRLKDEATANRRLGRLMCQYWRAAGAFDVKIERLSPSRGKVRLRVAWTRIDRPVQRMGVTTERSDCVARLSRTKPKKCCSTVLESRCRVAFEE